MTKKDYELIASVLRHQKPSALDTRYSQGLTDAWVNVVGALGRALALENPRFDADRFYAACGLEV